MKIFIIHSFKLNHIATPYAKELEASGHEVYLPARDTEQNQSRHGIIKDNLNGIKWADEVHMIWNGKSQGSLFDLATAYALEKPTLIVVVQGKGSTFNSGTNPWTSFCKDYVGEYIWGKK